MKCRFLEYWLVSTFFNLSWSFLPTCVLTTGLSSFFHVLVRDAPEPDKLMYNNIHHNWVVVAVDIYTRVYFDRLYKPHLRFWFHMIFTLWLPGDLQVYRHQGCSLKKVLAIESDIHSRTWWDDSLLCFFPLGCISSYITFVTRSIFELKSPSTIVLSPFFGSFHGFLEISIELLNFIRFVTGCGIFLDNVHDTVGCL